MRLTDAVVHGLAPVPTYNVAAHHLIPIVISAVAGREAGLNLQLSDVARQSLVPALACSEISAEAVMQQSDS